MALCIEFVLKKYIERIISDDRIFENPCHCIASYALYRFLFSINLNWMLSERMTTKKYIMENVEFMHEATCSLFGVAGDDIKTC